MLVDTLDPLVRSHRKSELRENNNVVLSKYKKKERSDRYDRKRKKFI